MFDSSNKNKELCERSGAVSFNDKLTSFLYELMRDHVPCGIIEELVRSSECDSETKYTNGWLAQYANDISKRLINQ